MKDWNISFLFKWCLKFIGFPPITSLYPLHASLHPSIHLLPLPPLFDVEAISQQSQPSLPAKLIWQVCIKAPDQYPLRVVRAKAKKNKAPGSPPLPLYQMRKNESWTLFFTPSLNRSVVLSPALYQANTHTHIQINTHTETREHTIEHRDTYTETHKLQAPLSPGWSAAIKLTEGLVGVSLCMCVCARACSLGT